MIRFIAVSSTLLCLLIFVGQMHAQEGPVFKAQQVPKEGRKAQDFVPAGWKIGASATGDLNGDQTADHVLQLVPSDYDSSGIAAAPEAQALLILVSDHGTLRRAALSTKLLATIVPQYIFDLSVKNGVVVIHQNFGMTDVSDLTHRFRLDPATQRFLLIGKDDFHYHRPQGPNWPATRISENYLTGVRLTTTDHWINEDTNKPVTKRGRVSRTRVFLEEVDESADY